MTTFQEEVLAALSEDPTPGLEMLRTHQRVEIPDLVNYILVKYFKEGSELKELLHPPSIYKMITKLEQARTVDEVFAANESVLNWLKWIVAPVEIEMVKPRRGH